MLANEGGNLEKKVFENRFDRSAARLKKSTKVRLLAIIRLVLLCLSINVSKISCNAKFFSELKLMTSKTVLFLDSNKMVEFWKVCQL